MCLAFRWGRQMALVMTFCWRFFGDVDLHIFASSFPYYEILNESKCVHCEGIRLWNLQSAYVAVMVKGARNVARCARAGCFAVFVLDTFAR